MLEFGLILEQTRKNKCDYSQMRLSSSDYVSVAH